jgi:hypothetical protein
MPPTIGYAAIASGLERASMASYHYVDEWHFHAPIDAVWTEISDPLDWSGWWSCFERVEQTQPGDERGVGAVHRYTVKGALPYRVSFEMRTTVVDKHRRIEGEALGDVRGRGIWTFEGDEKATHVRYDWIVDTTRPWMITLAPLLRPVFGWNHHFVMRRGLEGLTARLQLRGY